MLSIATRARTATGQEAAMSAKPSPIGAAMAATASVVSSAAHDHGCSVAPRVAASTAPATTTAGTAPMPRSGSGLKPPPASHEVGEFDGDGEHDGDRDG